MMYKKFVNFLSYWYLQYELITCIYMFEPWEKKLLSILLYVSGKLYYNINPQKSQFLHFMTAQKKGSLERANATHRNIQMFCHYVGKKQTELQLQCDCPAKSHCKFYLAYLMLSQNIRLPYKGILFCVLSMSSLILYGLRLCGGATDISRGFGVGFAEEGYSSHFWVWCRTL